MQTQPSRSKMVGLSGNGHESGPRAGDLISQAMSPSRAAAVSGEVPVLTFVSAASHPPSQQLAKVLGQVITSNRSRGIRFDQLDVDADPKRIRQLGLLGYPALVLTVGGVERARLVGPQSKRSVLQSVLPELYAGDEAVAQLRRQLDSPGEDFPRRVLRRRERVGKAARTDMLARVGLFEGLTKRQLDSVARVADDLVIEAGAVLIEEGTTGDQFFIVASGELQIESGGRQVATCEPGECFGEMSLLDGGPRTATVTANQVCVLVTLDRTTFEAVLLENPSVAVALLEVLSARVRSLSD